MSLIKHLRDRLSEVNELSKNNYKSIKSFNLNTLPRVIIVAIISVFLPMLFGFLRPSLLDTFPTFMISIALLTILYFLFELGAFQKNELIGAYLLAFIFYILVIYLSVLDIPIALLPLLYPSLRLFPFYLWIKPGESPFLVFPSSCFIVCFLSTIKALS